MAEPEPPRGIPEADSPLFDVEALDVYISCPAKYFYEFILGLGGHREDAAYVQFHRCVYGVLRFMSEARALTNLIGNGVAAIVIAKWEGELDTVRLACALDPEAPDTREPPDAIAQVGADIRVSAPKG